MNGISSFLEWLADFEGEDVVLDGTHYLMKHNMIISKNLTLDYFDDIYKEIEFGRSSYENGKYSILTVSITGKIKKYLCDFAGYKQVTMEFHNIDELIDYETNSIYPDNPNSCLYFYHNTLVFI